MGSGGPTKAVLTIELQEANQRIELLQAQLLQLSSHLAQGTTLTSPQQPAAPQTPAQPQPTALLPSSLPLPGVPAAISAAVVPPQLLQQAPPPSSSDVRPPALTVPNGVPSSIPVPGQVSAAPRPPVAPAAAAPRPPAARPRHPLIPAEQRARPSQAFIAKMGLPTASPKDLTLSVSFPPTIRGRFTMDRPPRRSNNDSKLVHSIGTMLVKGLGIPAPRLLKALSQHDSPDELSAALRRAWAPPQSAPSPPLGLQQAPPASIQRRSYLESLDEAVCDDHGTGLLASALLATPFDMPDLTVHTQWHEYLSPCTDMLKTAVSQAGTRHVLRLSFNTELIALAVRAHIERYTALLLPDGGAHSAAAIAALDPGQRDWVYAATRANAIHSRVELDVYGIRYETTLITGWNRGPDHQALPSETATANYDQWYGDTNRFLAFLNLKAPHCFVGEVTSLADGTGRIQFVHEAQHRNELYRLVDVISPSHGITRPLRLTFKQLRKPQAQCCSVCGTPGHPAHACPSRAMHDAAAPDEGKMEADDASLPPGSVVCRLCYSPGHRETCHTPPSQQACRICNESGHTSFHCPSYKTSWVPLSPPLSTHAPNPRPLALIAQQRGLPPPSWSAVAAGANPPPSQRQAPPPLANSHAFPALPARGPVAPASPTDSASSSSSQQSAPPSHFSEPSPAQPLSSELADLKAMMLFQHQSLTALFTASIEASNRRMDHFFSMFQLLLGVPRSPPPAITSEGPAEMALDPVRPSTPVYMQGVDHKSPETGARLAPPPSISPLQSQCPPPAQYAVHGYVPHAAMECVPVHGGTNHTGSYPLTSMAAYPPNHSTSTASSLPSSS